MICWICKFRGDLREKWNRLKKYNEVQTIRKSSEPHKKIERSLYFLEKKLGQL